MEFVFQLFQNYSTITSVISNASTYETKINYDKNIINVKRL